MKRVLELLHANWCLGGPPRLTSLGRGLIVVTMHNVRPSPDKTIRGLVPSGAELEVDRTQWIEKSGVVNSCLSHLLPCGVECTPCVVPKEVVTLCLGDCITNL